VSCDGLGAVVRFGGRRRAARARTLAEDNAIVRAWYAKAGEDPSFVDLWIHGIDTRELSAGSPAKLPQVFRVVGNKTFDTTCGGRSLPALEPAE
jgi:hypothetical protein